MKTFTDYTSFVTSLPRLKDGRVASDNKDI